MNKIDNTWIKDWAIEEDPIKEKEASIILIKLFQDFLKDYRIEDKSKSTQNRYFSHLHALGGHIIEKCIYDEDYKNHKTINILLDQLSPYEGPMIYWTNESWQNELDTVCKRLYKFLKRNNH